MTSPVVLITGALTGIGRATALANAREGARLVVSGRRQDGGEALTAELKETGAADAVFVRADVRREGEVGAMVDRAVERFGRLDIAVNNAGMGILGPIGEVTPEKYAELFDTNVLDVTEHCSDPVEAIMKVQLGGGTDIGNALRYAAGLIDNPRRTIVVLITDFYEGGPLDRLLGITRHLIEGGVTFLGLAALDERAEPNFDRGTAQRMAALGAHVGAMTPGELAEWVAQKVK